MKHKLANYTIAKQLKWRATYIPDHLALCYLADGENETERLTYGDLHTYATKIGAKLQALNLKNQPVLMLYNSGLEFVKAFFGCLYAGVVAVPTYVPKSKQILEKIENIQADCKAQVILTTEDLLDDEYLNSSSLATLKIIATDQIYKQTQSEAYFDHSTGIHDIIFIQYTSGSTSHPKGALVTNYNIMINQAMLQHVFELDEQSVGVTWLPLFHDMGLIASLLNAIFVGYPIYIMPPSAFIRKPLRWLQCISKYKGTYTCAPNFAYDLCMKTISLEERNQLDLSSLKKAINASEPVQPSTLEEFTKAFSACGFQAQAFTPAYGLAEATVFVTGKSDSVVKYIYLEKEALKNNRIEYSESPYNTVKMVGCGKANYLGQTIKIINPETREVTTNEIGEICIAGQHIVDGYLNKPDVNKEVFQLDIDALKYLRTGDLGFIDKGDELYITGRIKDLIIINGQNYYPQDIELTAESKLPFIRKNSIAAFSVEMMRKEQLILVIELNKKMLTDFDPHKLASEINQSVFKNNGLTPYEIIFIEQSCLPKTTSGKIQRYACKKLFLDNQLKIKAKWENPHAIETSDTESVTSSPASNTLKLDIINSIMGFLVKTFKIDPNTITPQSQFYDCNIDSIHLAALAVELEKIIKIQIPERVFYDCITIEEIADELINLSSGKESAAKTMAKPQLTLVSNNPTRKIAIPKFRIKDHKKIS